MKKGLLHKLILVCVVITLVFTFQTQKSLSAVTNPNDVSSLGIDILPKYPKAYEDVTVKIKSYAVDLNRAIVKWYVDGSLVQEGVGVKEYKVTSGAYGSTKTIKLNVIASDGTVIEKEAYITPSDVTIVLQPNTYIPPFYKGKRMFSHGADVLLTAIPDSKYAASQLIFDWVRETGLPPLQDGIGRDKVTIDGGELRRDQYISVNVESIDGKYSGHADFLLKSTYPQTLLYQDDPVLGIWFENSLSNAPVISSNEFNVAAFPYFFSVSNRFSNEVAYSWNVNNASSRAIVGSTITLKKDPSVNYALLGVDVRHSKRSLQFAKSAINLTFSSTNQ